MRRGTRPDETKDYSSRSPEFARRPVLAVPCVCGLFCRLETDMPRTLGQARYPWRPPPSRMGLKLFYLSIHPLASTRKAHGKIWLKSCPRAYRTTSTPSSTALWPTCWKSPSANTQKPVLGLHGPVDELRRAGTAVGRAGRLPVRPGPAARCAGGHHAAQHSAVWRDHGGRAARRLHLREREPAVHRPRTGAPAQGLGRYRHRHS